MQHNRKIVAKGEINLKPEGDLRVRRTRKMLHEAFIKLVTANGFDGVSVQHLTEEAMINRATFYRHYDDKFDLAKQVYDQLAAEYVTSIQATLATDPSKATYKLFEHVASYADFYLKMIDTMPQFRGWVQDNIEQELKRLFMQMGLEDGTQPVPTALSLRYLAAAQLGVVQWWLESGQQVSAEEMGQNLQLLHMQGGIQSLQHFITDTEIY